MTASSEINRGANGRSLVVLIPALNEARCIGPILDEVHRHTGSRVVVIDDQSSDDTVAVARHSGATVLPLSLHLGAWGAAQTGLCYAAKHGYRTAVTMDADGQHPPQAIAALVAPIDSGQADVAIGSCPRRGDPPRRLAWSLFRGLTRIRVADLTSGFRAYNRKAITCLTSSQTSLLDYQDLGVLIHLKNAGLKMVEVPVEMEKRREGRSRVFATWWTVLRYLVYTGILCTARAR
jgi:glycosyltransferase involved in cell wall biosynthesis